MNIRHLLLTLFIFSSFHAFSQNPSVSDTIEIKWDTLKTQGIGPRFAKYYQQGNTLLSVKSDSGLNVLYSSVNFGKSWQPIQRDFASMTFGDSTIIQTKYYWGQVIFQNGSYISYGTAVFLKSTDFGKTFNTAYYTDVKKYCYRGCSEPTFVVNFGHNDSIITVSGNTGMSDINRISLDNAKTWHDVTQLPFDKISNGYALLKKGQFLYFTENTDLIYKDSIDLSHYPSNGNTISDTLGIDYIFKDATLAIYKANKSVIITKDKGLTWSVDTIPFLDFNYKIF